MPQIRGLETLKKLCVSKIAFDIDAWCTNYIPEDEYMDILGPFAYTPSSILEFIIEELNLYSKISVHHLQFLIVEHLQKFVLQRKISYEIDQVLLLLIKQCKSLNVLSLANQDTISRHILNNAISQFRELTILKLSYCNVCDQTISVISANCNHLRDLDIMGTEVTDCGVFALFQDIGEDFLGLVRPRKSLVTSLESLDIRNTFVTAESVKGALLNLPNLTYLGSELVLIALAEILKSRDSEPERKEYHNFNLRNIQHKVLLPHKDINSDMLHRVLQVCPETREILCYGQPNNYYFFQQFATLKHISKLSLDSPLQSRISFDTQVLPILKSSGLNITSLSLGKFAKVDIPAIGLLCPHLDSLSLFENTCKRTRDVDMEPFFKNLTSLEIQSFGGPEMIEEDQEVIEAFPVGVSKVDLVSLLSSPLLQVVILTEQNNVDDVLIRKVLQTNCFPCLRLLSFEDCNFITNSTIWHFLHLQNPLRQLILRDCELITYENFSDFKDYLTDNGFFNVKLLYI